MQNRDRPDPATFLGSGRAEELAGLVAEHGAGLVIADGDLTPDQARNLQDRVRCRWWTGPC